MTFPQKKLGEKPQPLWHLTSLVFFSGKMIGGIPDEATLGPVVTKLTEPLREQSGEAQNKRAAMIFLKKMDF